MCADEKSLDVASDIISQLLGVLNPNKEIENNSEDVYVIVSSLSSKTESNSDSEDSDSLSQTKDTVKNTESFHSSYVPSYKKGLKRKLVKRKGISSKNIPTSGIETQSKKELSPVENSNASELRETSLKCETAGTNVGNPSAKTETYIDVNSSRDDVESMPSDVLSYSQEEEYVVCLPPTRKAVSAIPSSSSSSTVDSGNDDSHHISDDDHHIQEAVLSEE